MTTSRGQDLGGDPGGSPCKYRTILADPPWKVAGSQDDSRPSRLRAPRDDLSHGRLQRTHLDMSYSTPAGKRRSSEFGAAMSRSAELRQCPNCKRKSALIREPTDWDLGLAAVTYCRWCDYEKHGTVLTPAALASTDSEGTK